MNDTVTYTVAGNLVTRTEQGLYGPLVTVFWTHTPWVYQRETTI